MNSNNSQIEIKDNSGNPAVLGLWSFGATTVLLNLHNVGFIKMNSIILGMGIFVGGLAQIIAGYQEWEKNNTFGATAFTSYGMFWLTFVALLLIPQTHFGSSFEIDSHSLSIFLFMWGIFTLYMYVGTLKLNRMLQVVFLSLTILFFLLAIGEYTENRFISLLAGYEGIFCGFSAIYGSAAIVLNELYERPILPLGEKRGAKASFPGNSEEMLAG